MDCQGERERVGGLENVTCGLRYLTGVVTFSSPSLQKGFRHEVFSSYFWTFIAQKDVWENVIASSDVCVLSLHQHEPQNATLHFRALTLSCWVQGGYGICNRFFDFPKTEGIYHI